MSVRSLFDKNIPIELNASSSLWEKYRPRKISDFIGLETPKWVLHQYAANPFDKAWLFVGPSGTGKTAMALALAAEIAAEVHAVPASECNREKLNSLCEKCRSFPIGGLKRHLVLIDEADTLSVRIQTDLRSRLEGPSRLQNVVWVFTATSIEELDSGFTSRCMKLKFSTYGISKEATELLERVWEIEAADSNHARPNFSRMVKDSNNDIRAALNQLQTKIS